MNYLVFDIETTEAVGPGEITDLEISVVSVYTSKDKQIKSFTTQDLGKMWELFENTDVIIGYNSEHFDIPILNKYYQGDLCQIKSIDLLKSIKESFGRRVKLDDIAKATLGKKKIANGLQAIEWWKEGKLDEIKKYCEEDVLITKDIFEYAWKNKKLHLVNYNGEKIDIKIDTTDWDKKDKKSITFSMGF